MCEAVRVKFECRAHDVGHGCALGSLSHRDQLLILGDGPRQVCAIDILGSLQQRHKREPPGLHRFTNSYLQFNHAVSVRLYLIGTGEP